MENYFTRQIDPSLEEMKCGQDLSLADECPRVLVFASQPFNYSTGFGITLSNLFKDWPASRLACIYREDLPADQGICARHFRLGRQERGWAFPFNGLSCSRKVTPGGAPVLSSTPLTPRDGGGGGGWSLKRLALSLGLGAAERLRISPSLEQWLGSFRPEIVYGCPSSLPDLFALQELTRHLECRLVIHLLDDWVQANRQAQKFQARLLSFLEDMQLRKLFKEAALRLTIGQEMKNHYHHRYGQAFEAFQNCPESELWTGLGRRDWQPARPFRLVFTGAIYSGCNRDSILELSRAIDLLNRKEVDGFRLELHLSAPQLEAIRSLVQPCRGTQLIPLSEDQETVARLYGSADALVLPFDFGPSAQAACRYSMPTKLPAYMLSGSPILYFGPEELAVAGCLRQNDAGCLIAKCSPDLLARRIAEFALDTKWRQMIGLNARSFALEHFCAEEVRPRFRQLLTSVAGQRLRTSR